MVRVVLTPKSHKKITYLDYVVIVVLSLRNNNMTRTQDSNLHALLHFSITRLRQQQKKDCKQL